MIYINTFPGNLFRPQNVIFTFVCCQILIRIPKSISSVVRLSVSGVWGEWVPLSTVCPRQKRGFVPHHKSTTAWNAVRQCASRRPWLDEPGPPPSLELKIAGIIELKLADTNKEVTSSNKLRRAQAGGACSSGSQAKQT